MRLKKLQISGFKSFVDSTDIRFPAHLVGVVGPNGCGKSNVIDAVRWVMGESSAKMLRGDNMADVIFNGSAARKPVGKAAVELIFDNNDGRAPGNYGQFAEISVKRTLTRDGQSIYSINNLTTRRRDVLDLFRGTGLGPRSYSIIEQGMVSRIVEAQPEDLRAFVEEAAGTLKYKDRRRETETRIARTRENLERVSDIRDQLEKQLRRLKRQSAAANRYKKLKEQERQINGQLQVLRLHALDTQLVEQDRITAKHENTLQAATASQRQTEAELETLREQQAQAHEENNQIQQAFYRAAADISNLEQRIEHQNETQTSQTEELERLNANQVERQQQIESDRQKEILLCEQIEKNLPQLETVQSASNEAADGLVEAEKVLQDWLTEMEAFSEQSRAPVQQVEIQKSRIEYLEQHLTRGSQNKEKLEQQITAATEQFSVADLEALRLEVANHNEQYADAEKQWHESETAIKQLSAALEDKRDRAANARTQLQEAVSRLESLQEIQNAALGVDNEVLEAWLGDSGLGNAPKLAGNIKVSEGWERAVDRVLNGFLGAICAEKITIDTLRNMPNFGLSLITDAAVDEPSRRIELPGNLSALSNKIAVKNTNLTALLSGIYVADSLQDALSQQATLIGRECIVTREGVLVGANWVDFASESQLETGVLVREEEISQLQQRRLESTQLVARADEEIEDLDNQRTALESKSQAQRVALNALRPDMSSLHNRLGREEAQYSEAQATISKQTSEIEELVAQMKDECNEIEHAKALLETAAQQSGSLDQQREQLIQRRDDLNAQVVEKRNAVSQERENLHQKELQKQRMEADIEVLRENIKRLRQEAEQADLRVLALTEKGSNPSESITELAAELEQLLEQKLAIDTRFSSSKDQVASFDNNSTEINAKRSELVGQVTEAREILHQHKLSKQEIKVRRDAQSESIEEQGYNIEQCEAELADDATAELWHETRAAIELKIARIGPVNLVAIEEFDEESERMQYLDTQHADLTEALETLESVMRKIDRESRARFKQTFDKINTGFNEFFPKLFGGGNAELYLTSDDLLSAGIGVIARPPGKRNSHIHLLSGGEKALTAVALLFSLFKLNPSPFCMLDEVDAPLDDANVDRYCQTLHTLAEVSQMIVITHNKITMEAMDLLVGVTMAEAGVSRLVSVNIDQAIEMAAQ